MSKMKISNWLKPAFLAGSVMALGACSYGVGGGGYYGDGYVNGAGYSCDPYAPFDDYYACDSGYGFANIGFGGGWHDNYYYPGYGYYLFDRGGSRYKMRNNHRRYWAHRRAQYGAKQGRRGDRRYGYRNRKDDGLNRDQRRENRAERRENWSPERRAAWQARRDAYRAGNGDTSRQERRANRRSRDGSSATTNRRGNNANRRDRGQRMGAGMERRRTTAPTASRPARTKPTTRPQRAPRQPAQSRQQRSKSKDSSRSMGRLSDL